MAKPVSETQSINPGSVIEMFELTTDAALHGSATTYRFHDGSNPIAYGTGQNAHGNIVWNGNTYVAVPLEADGFKYANGQLPRPTLTISNPTAEYAKEIYKIDRKSSENRAVVQFELAAAFDLANIRIPLRVCTRELFPSIGSFVQ